MATEIAIAFDRFGKYVVQQSRTNLTKTKHKDRGDLYDSLKYDVKQSKNSVQFSMYMEDYGVYVDKGVKGKEEQKKAPRSPFKYRDKMPPPKVFSGWVVRKNIAPRTKGGQFAARKSLQYAIAMNIFKTGLATTNFFTKPFERAFDRLPDEIVEAYSLDLDKFMKATLENAK